MFSAFNPAWETPLDSRELLEASRRLLAPRQLAGKNWVQKRVPNRIIDAEGVGKPLDRYLARYDSALEGILAAPGRILAAI